MRVIKEVDLNRYKLNKTEQKRSINEAFRKGKTVDMIDKIMAILGRRVGFSSYNISPVPDYYANKYGSFTGFFASYDEGNYLRFNFSSTSTSDSFYSIDLFDLAAGKPSKTISLEGFNVVEVLDFVSDILTGDYKEYAESHNPHRGNQFKERVTYENSVRAWINSDVSIRQRLDDIVSSSNSRNLVDKLNEIRPEFENYLAMNHRRNSRNAESAFKYWVKRILSETGSTDAQNIPSVEVLPGSPENLTNGGQTVQETAYNDLMKNEHIYKFNALKKMCLEIKKGNKDFKSLYIYGDGGIGKSYWIKKILGPLPQTNIIVGKMSGYTALVQRLFENREGKILVLDDLLSDKDMNNPSIAGILKAALDPDPPRLIQVVKSGRHESYAEKGKIYLNESDYRQFSAYKKSVLLNEEEDDNEEDDMSMVDISRPIDTPEKFVFNSVIIFITNYKKVPQPIEDRCWILQLEFNNNQIIDLIEHSLSAIEPEADSEILKEVYDETKIEPETKEVLNMLKGMESANAIPRKLSFRVFNRLVTLRHMYPVDEDYRRYTMIELGV